MLLLGPDAELIESTNAADLPDVRVRDGLYQIADDPTPERRAGWMRAAADDPTVRTRSAVTGRKNVVSVWANGT